jgi:single-stranded-DNA-specific exonuclease RecJ
MLKIYKSILFFNRSFRTLLFEPSLMATHVLTQPPSHHVFSSDPMAPPLEVEVHAHSSDASQGAGTVVGVLGSVWEASEQRDKALEPWHGLLETTQQDALLAKLLYSRGIHTPLEANHWLHPEAFDAYHTQQDAKRLSGWALPDADLAIERINQAIQAQETIVVYGDFDVDGVTGTTIFVETLQALKADVHWYIPDRLSESHGLNAKALVTLVALQKPKLIITTDTGIMNHKEIQLLKNLKVDTVVTDHHGLPDVMPPAFACVNPRRLEEENHPLKHLCGAGTAYKLCVALIEHHKPKGYKKLIEKLADLVAIGTVADLVPLVGENRRLVQRGLPSIANRRRFGLKCLLDKAGLKGDTPITSETIGFVIGPRINAMGRLDHAQGAVKLMLTEDAAEAEAITETMEALNRERQLLCDTTTLEAEEALKAYWGEQPLESRPRVIILSQADWHPGVIGIVASRLIDRYHVPVFLMAQDSETQHWRGSARSIAGFSVSEALEHCHDYLMHYGGHAGAGGWKCSSEHLESFITTLQSYALKVLPLEACVKRLKADCLLNAEDISPELLSRLNQLAPFGMKNPEPRFLTKSCKVLKSGRFGKDKKHLKLTLETQGYPLEAIMWKYPESAPLPEVASSIEAIGSLEANHYPDAPPFRLQLKDWRDPLNPSLHKVGLPDAPVRFSKKEERVSPLQGMTSQLPPLLLPPVLPPLPSVSSASTKAMAPVVMPSVSSVVPSSSSTSIMTTLPPAHAIGFSEDTLPSLHEEPSPTTEKVSQEASQTASPIHVTQYSTEVESVMPPTQAHEPVVTTVSTMAPSPSEAIVTAESPIFQATGTTRKMGYQLIDHRGRMPNSLQDFPAWHQYWHRVLDWQTTQTQQDVYARPLHATLPQVPMYYLYHEGMLPQAALFPDTMQQDWLQCMVGRVLPDTPIPPHRLQTGMPSPVLILWDIPPSQKSLQALLQHYQPQWIHLMPGKPQRAYTALPFLQTLLGVLHKAPFAPLLAKASPLPLEDGQTLPSYTQCEEAIQPFASKIATSPQVAWQLCHLLQAMGILRQDTAEATASSSWQLHEESLHRWQTMSASEQQATLLSENPWGLTVLASALQEVTHWRHWAIQEATYTQWQALLKTF